MATIRRHISKKVNAAGECEILLRVSVRRGCAPLLQTGVFVAPARFRDGVIVKPRANREEVERLTAVDDEVGEMERHVSKWLARFVPSDVTIASLRGEVMRYRREKSASGMGSAAEGGVSFEGLTEGYVGEHVLSDSRVAQMKILGRSLMRFAGYSAAVGRGETVTVDGLTVDDLGRYEEFLHSEHRVCKLFPELYVRYPLAGCGGRVPKPRSNNYVAATFARLRAVYNWAVERGLTVNNPCQRYKPAGGGERYGRPYFLTYEEMRRIARADLSGNEGLARQRDVFLFQCLVGCRVSDLRSFTRDNVDGGVLSYIPRKTMREGGDVVRVPLTEDALEILARYPDNRGGRLLPCITDQRYNKAIKEIFRVCGLTRMVPVLDRTTGEKTLRPLNEIASSHIARRTLIGNLYRQLKDPNLIGEITGHRNGSVSFRRYRDVDDEVKRDVLGLIPRIF